jgi:hypothetical protein
MMVRKQRAPGSMAGEYSPHRHFRYYIVSAWMFSTGLGTVLLLMEVAVVGCASRE